MKLNMRNGYIAVKALKGEKQTKSGIIVPENADQTQTTHAEVVEACDGSEYKPGDVVLFSKLVPDDVEIEDSDGKPVELWFVLESDIKCKPTWE